MVEEMRDVNGLPINPTARVYPRKCIQTGISAIDGMNTLVRGQKLPIFSGTGLPHDQIVAQITRQAKIVGEDVQFAIVFAAMGIKHDVARFFIDNFQEHGRARKRGAVPLSRRRAVGGADPDAAHGADDRRVPGVPREHARARHADRHDELLRVAPRNLHRREEIPSRKGYPGYLYSDLSSIYERAGMVKGYTGSITQMPILTMPNDDISHPMPDLSGYITEGQIVLERELDHRNIYPPIAGFRRSRGS